jgi:hypothetical protein
LGNNSLLQGSILPQFGILSGSLILRLQILEVGAFNREFEQASQESATTMLNVLAYDGKWFLIGF